MFWIFPPKFYLTPSYYNIIMADIIYNEFMLKITFRANPSHNLVLLNIRILYIRQRNDIRFCYPISGTDISAWTSYSMRMYFNMYAWRVLIEKEKYIYSKSLNNMTFGFEKKLCCEKLFLKTKSYVVQRLAVYVFFFQ